ncbi:MAG: DEAD/DEAH box helicase, partial [Acidimicrobiaceae bacterium]|nr:DEAD/DEAH box helicase [Acidimicrobiaceae bacterium]
MGLTVGPPGVVGGRYGGGVVDDPLAAFSEPTRAWFASAFAAPTAPQAEGWPAIAAGDHTLVCAPTGTGKTLAAFLWAID